MKHRCENCGYSVYLDETLYPAGSEVTVECQRCHSLVRFEIEGTAEDTASAEASPEEQGEEAVSGDNSAPPSKPKRRKRKNLAPDGESSSAEEGGDGDTPAALIPPEKPQRKSSRSSSGSGKPRTSASSSRGRNANPPKKPTTIGCGILWLIIWIAPFAIGGWFLYDWLHSRNGSSNDAVATDSAEVVEVVEEPVYENYEEPYDTTSEEEVVEEPVAEEATKPSYWLDFPVGLNFYNGDMIHTDDSRYPFKLRFNYEADGSFKNIEYLNVSSGTRVKMALDARDDTSVRFKGRDGGKDFIIYIDDMDSHTYSGDAYWGDFHQRIEIFR